MKTHMEHDFVSLSKTICLHCLVVVQPTTKHPDMREKWLNWVFCMNSTQSKPHKLAKWIFIALTLYLLVSSADNLSNSLDLDQTQQNVRPDLDPNCLTF